MSREEEARRLRRSYDDETFRAGRAQLRRCRSPAEVMLEGAYWSLLGRAKVSPTPPVAALVACFPAADQLVRWPQFRLGRYLRDSLYRDVRDSELPARATRIRQLLAVRDDDQVALVHVLRRLLGHAANVSGRGVDWGAIAWPLALWGDAQRMRLASDFYVATSFDQESVHE